VCCSCTCAVVRACRVCVCVCVSCVRAMVDERCGNGDMMGSMAVLASVEGLLDQVPKDLVLVAPVREAVLARRTRTFALPHDRGVEDLLVERAGPLDRFNPPGHHLRCAIVVVVIGVSRVRGSSGWMEAARAYLGVVREDDVAVGLRPPDSSLEERHEAVLGGLHHTPIQLYDRHRPPGQLIAHAPPHTHTHTHEVQQYR